MSRARPHICGTAGYTFICWKALRVWWNRCLSSDVGYRSSPDLNAKIAASAVSLVSHPSHTTRQTLHKLVEVDNRDDLVPSDAKKMTEGLPDTGNNKSRDNSPEATESAQVGAAHEPSRQLNQDASGRAQQHETIEDENTLGDGDENDDSAAEDDEEDEDEDEDEDEEPKLKYARLTQHLGPVYRNGDATSSFLVGGDKMVQFRRARWIFY